MRWSWLLLHWLLRTCREPVCFGRNQTNWQKLWPLVVKHCRSCHTGYLFSFGMKSFQSAFPFLYPPVTDWNSAAAVNRREAVSLAAVLLYTCIASRPEVLCVLLPFAPRIFNPVFVLFCLQLLSPQLTLPGDPNCCSAPRSCVLILFLLCKTEKQATQK